MRAPEASPPDAARAAALQAQRQALPAWAARARLLQELAENCAVLILAGETGSGKSTQVPQFLLDAGFAKAGLIGVTQPRRVAAVTVAQRVAQERGGAVGQEVGYAVRFEDHTSLATRLKYMTDGLLLREALSDQTLQRYQVVVLDEAHERTLQTDVLLGLLKGILAARPTGFQLLIMSATLDIAKFAAFFPGAKVALIQGRQHPVRVYHTTVQLESYLDATLATILQIHEEEGPGDVLAFLTGAEEVDAVEQLLLARVGKGAAATLAVCGLYAGLPFQQQQAALLPAKAGQRKVILATNIAETSVTVPGVRYVVDSGCVKVRTYSAERGMEALQVQRVSQAQARQRSGRAGREAPGKAFRLYTEDAFGALAPAAVPELARSNLAAAALQLRALGVRDVLGFAFLDPPPRLALQRALEALVALGALDGEGQLTPTGQTMARLPLDPPLAKVLVSAGALGCSAEAATIVALTSEETLFLDARGRQEEVAEARRGFVTPEGDHLTLLRLFQAYSLVPERERRAWCQARWVRAAALRRAAAVRDQLQRALAAARVPWASCAAEDLTPVRRALASGLFSNAAVRLPEGSYKLLGQSQTVQLHPSSVLASQRAPCIVFETVLKTSRDFALKATAIDAAWLPEVAPAFFRTSTG